MVTIVKILVAIIKVLISLGKFGALDGTLEKLEEYLAQNSGNE